MKYFSNFATSFLTHSKKVAYSVSRLFGLFPNIRKTRVICGAEIRDMGYWVEGEKWFAYFSSALYYELYKLQFFSQTGYAARVSCGVWYLTQGIDAEPVVSSHGINSTRVPSPLVVSGTDKMGGKNNPHNPLRSFEAACAVPIYAY